jgi:hypothetical protein
LGAGTGICGLVASQFAKHVGMLAHLLDLVITDYKDVVLNLIKKNIADYSKPSEGATVSYAKIDWQNTDYSKVEIFTPKKVDGEIEEDK